MKAVILAAGQGTRLGNLTAKRPKPMLPIGGRPLLEQTIIWLRGHGVHEIGINLHYMADAIVDRFGSGESLGVSITYSVEETLLGTAGALTRFSDFLDESFVVIYGDVLTNINLARLSALHAGHEDSERGTATATLALYRVDNPTECGLIELDARHRVVSFMEKPRQEDVRTDLAFSGVMVCETDVLQLLPRGEPFDFGFDVFPILLQDGMPFYGYALGGDEYVVDIGTMPGYRRALALQWVGEA